MSAAWYLAIMMKTTAGWTNDIKPAETEIRCFDRARATWSAYWMEGKENDDEMRVMCFEEPYNKRYWIRCAKSGMCTLK